MTLTDRQKGWVVLGAVALGSIVLDQGTKVWAESSLKGEPPCAVSPHPVAPQGCITVIEGKFNLQYARNPGAAFSMFADLSPGSRLALFLVISLVAIAAMVWLYHQLGHRRPLYEWALGLLIGGAAGNLIDRLRFNEVIDFIQMFHQRTAWPTYNIADAAIVIGIGLVMVDALLHRKEAVAESGRARRARPGRK